IDAHIAADDIVRIDPDKRIATAVTETIGYAHAASGLMEVAACLLSHAVGRNLRETQVPLNRNGTTVVLSALGHQHASIRISPSSRTVELYGQTGSQQSKRKPLLTVKAHPP